MKRFILLLLIITASKLSSGQDVKNLYFNLYTDSLKKGFYNYISVDVQDPAGNWLPLDSTQVIFNCNTVFFKGNDLFIDSSYVKDSVIVTAMLKKNPSIKKEVVIYIRKRPFEELLKTNEEILGEIKNKKKKS